MKQFRIYVAVPLTHRRNRERAQCICDFFRENGAEVISPWVAEKVPKQDLTTPEQVYQRDTYAVKLSNAMVADVSDPSLGVGMEIMLAQNKGIPIVCLHEQGINISWMVVGCPGVKLIPYSPGKIDEALKKTVLFLKLLPETVEEHPKRLEKE